MRSQKFWYLFSLLAIAATGCSVNYSTCDSGCDVGGRRLLGGGCDSGCGCEGTVGCDDRCSTGLQGRLARPALLSRLRGGDCGCGSTGCTDGSCGTGGTGGVLGGGFMRGGLLSGGVAQGSVGCNDCNGGIDGMGQGLSLPALGGGMFAQGYESTAACSTGDCNGGYADGGVAPVGGLLGAGGMIGGGHQLGCGHFGCGTNGRLCLGCRLKGAMGLRGRRAGQHPYGGEIPHTDPNAYAGQGMGAGPAPAYAYPYYTTRGPRDFLQDKPASIGW